MNMSLRTRHDLILHVDIIIPLRADSYWPIGPTRWRYLADNLFIYWPLSTKTFNL